MDQFLYVVALFAVLIAFCAAVLGFLVLMSAAFLNDPEFDYVDDLKDLEEDKLTPLLGVVAPKEKRDMNA